MRVACCQIAPELGALEHNRERAAAAVRAAAAAGAGVVVLPELCVSGYVLESADEARALGEPVDGPTVSGWAALSAQLGVVIVGGFCELAPDGRLHNSAALVEAGGTRAVYRKAHLWDREPLVFAPGDAPPPVVDTRAGRIGVVVCYDLEFPEWIRLPALDGAQLLAAPANWPAGALDPAAGGADSGEVLRARANACVNRMFVAVCDRHGRERGVDWVGGSLVCDPDGALLAAPPAGRGEALLLADCDLRTADDKRVGTGNDVLADRRPELYGRVAER
jgi:predicted amidohydrolase